MVRKSREIGEGEEENHSVVAHIPHYYMKSVAYNQHLFVAKTPKKIFLRKQVLYLLEMSIFATTY